MREGVYASSMSSLPNDFGSPAYWDTLKTQDEVFTCVVRAAVPALADWAELFSVRGDTLALVAWLHADPTKTPFIPLRRTRAPSLRPVLEGKGEEVISDLPPSLIPSFSPDEEHLRLTRELGLHSYLTVPISLTGPALAVLRLVRGERAGFSEGDLSDVRSLTRQAALVLSRFNITSSRPLNVEARYQALVHDSPQAVEVWSRDGTLLEVNRAWEQLIGLDGDDLARFNLFENEQMRAAKLVPLFERSFLGERVTFPVVLFDPRNWRSTATPQWLRTVPLPVRDARGKVRELIIVHEAATEPERLAAARRLETLGLVLPPELDPRVLVGRGPLSPREREVLQLVTEGHSNKQIAAALGISDRTAKFHVTSILNKLGTDTRAGAVAVAAQRGFM
jgi:DNA-binding CsgD family transcriptional regulator/PAS domain-containing protein